MRRRITPAVALFAVVASFLLAVACAPGRASTSAPPTAPDRTVPAEEAVALTALPGGGLLFGERRTGRVLEVTSAGAVRSDPVARVAVPASGERGLLGLAVDGGGRVFAAWIASDSNGAPGRLTVGQIFPGAPRPVWQGPPGADTHNGGHLVFGPDGRLVLGVGDLGDPAQVADPTSDNGKLLSLDPDGLANQGPVVISSGWTDPVAFALTPAGHLWVADRSTGRWPAQLARGDVGGRPSSTTPLVNAPRGLAALSETDVLLCGSLAGMLSRWQVGSARARLVTRSLGSDCTGGVIGLSDGRVAYASATAIHLVTLR